MLMVRQVLAITSKEIKRLLRDQKALLLLFLMPAFFIVVMSFALKGVFEAGSRHQPIEILVVNQDTGELAAQTLEAARNLDGLLLRENWGESPPTRDGMEQRVKAGKVRFGLLFAPGYTARLRDEGQDTGPVVRLIVDPVVNTQLQTVVKEALGAVVEQIRVTERLGDWLAQTGSGDEADLVALLANPETRVVPDIEPPEGYNPEQRPTSTEQNVPAYAIFGMFFIMLTIAKSFLQEHTDGVHARILMVPLHPGVFLLGKLLPYYIINLLQVAVMFTLGSVVFGLRIGDPLAFGLISLATALAACGLGVLVASLGRSEAQVDTLSMLLAITLAALGGLMVPAYIMPGALQTVSLYTPHAWALRGYQDVIVRGLGVPDIVPELTALLGFALAFMVIGVWRLRSH